jgi:transcriptional regulator with XRE-family HTH domain
MNADLRRILSARLREARDLAGYTQEQVAETLDMGSADPVWQWETGRQAPMIDRLVHLSRLYGISVDWVLGRSEELRYEGGLSSHEELIVSGYRSLPQNDRRALVRILQALLSSDDDSGEEREGANQGPDEEVSSGPTQPSSS